MTEKYAQEFDFNWELETEVWIVGVEADQAATYLEEEDC